MPPPRSRASFPPAAREALPPMPPINQTPRGPQQRQAAFPFTPGTSRNRNPFFGRTPGNDNARQREPAPREAPREAAPDPRSRFRGFDLSYGDRYEQPIAQMDRQPEPIVEERRASSVWPRETRGSRDSRQIDATPSRMAGLQYDEPYNNDRDSYLPLQAGSFQREAATIPRGYGEDPYLLPAPPRNRAPAQPPVAANPKPKVPPPLPQQQPIIPTLVISRALLSTPWKPLVESLQSDTRLRVRRGFVQHSFNTRFLTIEQSQNGRPQRQQTSSFPRPASPFSSTIARIRRLPRDSKSRPPNKSEEPCGSFASRRIYLEHNRLRGLKSRG